MSQESFNDVLFVPQYSDITSRSTVDVRVCLGKFSLGLPVISANMKDITGPRMAATMAMHGGLGILHRFGSIEDAVNDYEEALRLLKEEHYFRDPPEWFINSGYTVGVSLGVQEEDKERFYALYDKGALLFTIDVAHGHHVLVKNMIQWIRKTTQDHDICIIAGNVATPEGAKDLFRWGADVIKVGIGPGAVCQTRKNTGVGVSQLYALRRIKEECLAPIIADGGIKSTGDIAKALKYADAVMLGSYIAGTSETPGHVYQTPDEQFYKVYGGSASGERKVENGRENTFVEGIIAMIPFKGHVKFILRKIKENLQSSFSYSGASTLRQFQEKATFGETISSSAKQESKL